MTENVQSQIFRWEITRTKCSTQCGEGVQQVSHKCIQTYPHLQHKKVVDDSHCPAISNTKTYEKCMGPCLSATWTYEEWGPVHIASFTIHQFAVTSLGLLLTSLFHFLSPFPSAQCSRSCDGGNQSRTAFCTSHLKGQLIDERYCAKVIQDDLTRPCNTHECPKWQYGDESPVSSVYFNLAL